eukprot:COSAG06_NODE_4537_length_4166_cov_34.424391_2_plen_152_part_00
MRRLPLDAVGMWCVLDVAAGMDGVRALILREAGVLALWRLRRANRTCKDRAEEALAELPRLAMLTERRCRSSSGSGGNDVASSPYQGQPWELLLREMSWLDWSCTATVLPMPPVVSPPVAHNQTDGHDGGYVEDSEELQRAVVASGGSERR